jgi:hypothetical protein
VHRFDSGQSINVLASDRLYHYIGMCYVCCLLMINHNVMLNFQFRSSFSFFVSTRNLPYTGKTYNYCEGVKSSFQVKTSYMSFQNVIYDWFIDWLLVAECPLCKCKSLEPLNLILGHPYGN